MSVFSDAEVQKAHRRREKEKARKVRKSTFWQAKVQKEGRCYYCHKPLTFKDATLDHIVPLSRGGKTQKGNVALACKDCNSAKKAQTPVEWQVFAP